MRLHHTTTKTALRKIWREGLLASKAIRRRKAVWLHERRLSMWAFLHVGKRQSGRMEDLVCIEVDVPRSWLTRYSDGVFFVCQDIPAERIRGVRHYGVTKEEIIRR